MQNKSLLLMIMLTAFILNGCTSYNRNNADENITESEAETETDISSLPEEETTPQMEEEQFYNKLSKGEDVSILIVGDSIGCGSGASGTEYRWAELTCEHLKEKYGVNTSLTNVSMGGNASYAGYVRTLALNDNINYDAVILCYGQNDSEKSFSFHYETIIRAIRI
ncbi:SGNH/GDSL hydrolase family protein [Lachnospiraceae bacterium C1.1]|nr:SGNH/GDSL hydrolase family protein [Lachnospiraceae bacterium C1.1]